MGAWNGENPEAGDALWAYLDAIGTGFRAGAIVLGDDDEKFSGPVAEAGRKLVFYPSITLPRDILMPHLGVNFYEVR